MMIHPEGGSWSHSRMSAISMSEVELFYFTARCSGCFRDTLVSVELEQGDVRFRCPHCDAEVDHEVVMACDKKGLREHGWFVKETG